MYSDGAYRFPHEIIIANCTIINIEKFISISFMCRWNQQLLFLWPMDASKYFWYISGAFSNTMEVPHHMFISWFLLS